MTTMMMATATETIKSPGRKTEEFLSNFEFQQISEIYEKETEPELIPPSAYWADIKARWKIVKRELKDLVKDIKKLIDFCTPYVLKGVDWTKNTFKKIKSKLEKQN